MSRADRSAAPDVIVIGGGIIGVSAAAHVAETGRRVLLLERDRVAAGASGRNSGVVQHPFDPVLVSLHLETLALYRRLEARSGGTFRLPDRPAGLLQLTDDEVQARDLARSQVAAYPGLTPTFLTAEEVRRLEPGVAGGIAACRLEIGYPVGPARATHAYAALAHDLGVEIRTATGARPEIIQGRVVGARLDDGRMLPTETLLVAAGPWTSALVDPSGTWRPIRPLWGVVVTVELSTPPGHVLEEAAIEIEPAGAPTAGRDSAAFSLITADGASSLGSTFLGAEPDAAARLPALVERGARFVPAISNARLGTFRVCARPLSDDGRPLIGRIPSVEGLWVAAGHGPWGISTGPASGRLVADLIAGRVSSPPATLDPARFGSPAI